MASIARTSMNPKPDRARLLWAQRRVVSLFVLSFAVNFYARADMTWLYAVQLSATIQTNPPQITLHWPPDEYGANSYVVYRKLKDEGTWGLGVSLPGSATTFIDDTVSLGSAYEYKVIKDATLGYVGYGYIYAGIDASLIESRGKIIPMLQLSAVNWRGSRSI